MFFTLVAVVFYFVKIFNAFQYNTSSGHKDLWRATMKRATCYINEIIDVLSYNLISCN